MRAPRFFAALLAAACSAAPADDARKAPGAAPPPEVRIVRPERQTIARTVTLTASLEAYEQAPLYAKVPGYVTSVGVDIGDVVAAGQLLVTLEMPEMAQRYAQAESRLAEQRAELAKAVAESDLRRTIHARSRELRRRDAITKQDLEEARAAAATASSQVDLERARLASAEARLAEVAALLQYGELRAPFAGVVTRRLVDRGALVQAATTSSGVSPVVVVARTDLLRVLVDVPEPDAPFVDRDDAAALALAAMPGQQFPLRIARTAGALDPGSRTMRCEADLPNPNGVLRPGMYGRLAIDVERHENALTVPDAAVQRGAARTLVFVLDGDRAAARLVTAGIAAGGRTEIVEGLVEDDPVILAASNAVRDGAPVQIVRAGGSPR